MDNNSYQPSVGSLTGFDSVELTKGTPKDLVKLGWSVEQIRAFLLNESDINFPSEDWVRQVDDLINDHINDHNNPHKVTIEQLTPSFARDVLGAITTGSPPRVPPFFAYDTACALPLNDIFPANFASENLYRYTEGGVFVSADTEINEMGVDCTVGKSGIPLFGPITNTVYTNWATHSDTPINTIVTRSDVSLGGYPFDSFVVTETSVYGDFGVGIAASRIAGQSYTFTAFIERTIIGGSLVISQTNTDGVYMTVDLLTGEVVLTGSDIKGEAFVYPSGIIRIAFSFTATSSSNINAVQVLHQLDGLSTTTRDGGDSALFTMARPLLTQSSLNHPSLADETLVASTDPFDLQLPRIPATPSLSNLMITMTLNMYPMLLNQANTDTSVLSFDALSIERDDTTLFVKHNGSVLFEETIKPGTNILALSYSPTRIILKTLVGARRSVDGAFGSLITQRVSVGPCGGYLQKMAIYGSSDDTHNLEYLTNG